MHFSNVIESKISASAAGLWCKNKNIKNVIKIPRQRDESSINLNALLSHLIICTLTQPTW